MSNQWIRSQWMRNQWMRNQWMRKQWIRNQWMCNQWIHNQWMRNQWMHNQWMGSQWGKEMQTTEIHHTNYFCISILLSLRNSHQSDHYTSSGVVVHVVVKLLLTCNSFMLQWGEVTWVIWAMTIHLKFLLPLKNSLLYALDRRGVWCFKSTNTAIVERCTGNQ